MVAHPLDGPRSKVKRAREHLKALDAKLRAFWDSQPYGFLGQGNANTREYIVYCETRGIEIPDGLGLIVGDIAHNLWSALDHLAIQLADKAGTGSTRDTQWPMVRKSAKEFRRKEHSLLAGIVEPYLTRIERYQPYHLTDYINAAATEPIPSPFSVSGGTINLFEGVRNSEDDRRIQLIIWLMSIHSLDNMDKHRLILPTSPLVSRQFPPLLGVSSATFKLPPKRASMEDGAELFRYINIVPTGEWSDVKVKGNPTGSILFGYPKSGEWGAVMPSRDMGAANADDFRGAATAIDGLIESFADAF